MKFDDVARVVGDIPVITPDRGRVLYDFILSSRCRSILELGFAHGSSTCYIAAALDEAGCGHVTTMDNQSAKVQNPDIYSLLSSTALISYVTPIFADTSYNWELRKLIVERSRDGVCHPLFDFCYFDGAHTWETDGFTFFLVDKLLKPGGWILFDDLDWTFATSPSLKETEMVRAMPDDQKTITQVQSVFSLLVGQHTSYSELTVKDNWGWARKVPAVAEVPDVARTVVLEDAYASGRGIREDAASLARKIWTRKIAPRGRR